MQAPRLQDARGARYRDNSFTRGQGRRDHVAVSDKATARHAGGPVCYLTRFIFETAGAVAFEHLARSARVLTSARGRDAVGDEGS